MPNPNQRKGKKKLDGKVVERLGYLSLETPFSDYFSRVSYRDEQEFTIRCNFENLVHTDALTHVLHSKESPELNALTDLLINLSRFIANKHDEFEKKLDHINKTFSKTSEKVTRSTRI